MPAPRCEKRPLSNPYLPVCAAFVGEAFAWMLKRFSAPLLRKIAGRIIVKHTFES